MSFKLVAQIGDGRGAPSVPDATDGRSPPGGRTTRRRRRRLSSEICHMNSTLQNEHDIALNIAYSA
jgi:hypothetical protein